MRFREYNNNNPKCPCTEYVLSSTPEQDESTRKMPLWSVSKTPKLNNESPGQIKRSNYNIWTRTGDKVKQVCCDLFLPIGYPDTVANGYLQYQIYDSIQGLCSYLRGVVSTSAVLMAAGVGDAEATAMSAAMTWAIRDGLGMIGGLFFSYVASPHFDAHVKEFRLLADVLNDIGLTLDMALPLLMSYEVAWLGSPYLVLTSCSTLCKVACGISAGATKGNITDHFSIGGNRADVNSKESTQETLVSLIGMTLGIWLTKFLQSLEKLNEYNALTCTKQSDNNESCYNNSSPIGSIMTVETITWLIFLVLTFIHVWANYIGVQRLRLRTLNRERARVTLQPTVEECGKWVLTNQSPIDKTHTDSEMDEVVNRCVENLPSPEKVSESLWKSILGMFIRGNLNLGIRVKDLVCISSSEWKQQICDYLNEEFSSEMYLIFVSGVCSRGVNNKKPNISVMMKLGARNDDELKAFLHAQIVCWCIEHDASNQEQCIQRSHQIVQHFFEKSPKTGDKPNGCNLINALSGRGWDVSRLYLGFSNWKCDWDFGHVKEE